ncbi:Transmembrane protein [Turdus rufiventris]|nr:Transmembrane protein [Turdus rufiventris]
MRLLGGVSCALWVLLLLLARGSCNEDANSTKDTNSTTIPGNGLSDNSSLPTVTASSTQSTATPTEGASTSTAHLTNTSQPNTTTTSVNLTTQPTKTSQTVTPTTASPVTSAQANITVVTTSKTSSTSVTATSKSEAAFKTSRFDVGSFIGGIVLTLGVLVILYIGCKTYHSRRGIQYRTMQRTQTLVRKRQHSNHCSLQRKVNNGNRVNKPKFEK